LAQGLKWTPPHLNTPVILMIDSAAAKQPLIRSARAFDPDPTGQLLKPELGIEVAIEAGLGADSLQQVLAQFGSDLQSQEFLQLVDSVSFRLTAR
jgi:hypothetical protein